MLVEALRSCLRVLVLYLLDFQESIVPLNQIEYGFGYIIIRSPYFPYSIYLRGTIYSHGISQEFPMGP